MVLLLEGSADLVGLDPMSQMTPLLRASLGGRVVVINSLVGAHVDANPANFVSCRTSAEYEKGAQTYVV